MKWLPFFRQGRFSLTPVTFFLFGFLFLVVVFTYQIGRNVKDIHDWRAKIAKEQQVYAREETRKDALERMKKAAVDSNAMLRYLKRQFGFLQPGEFVYRLQYPTASAQESASRAPTLWQALFAGAVP